MTFLSGIGIGIGITDIMKFKINIEGNEDVITDLVGEIMLACEKFGIVRSRCQKGICSSCQVKLVSGDVEEVSPMLALTENEKFMGAILPCVVIPKSDLVIERWNK